jgi:dTDP-4-amino-4,6-dideoxygalactose transaminase
MKVKVFVATSLKNGAEAGRICDLLTKAHCEVFCALSDRGNLQGAALFNHNFRHLREADLFVAVLKDVGRDVAAEIGMARALGKASIGVLYNLSADDVMPFYALDKLVKEEEFGALLLEVIPGLAPVLSDAPAAVKDGALPYLKPDLIEHLPQLSRDLEIIVAGGQLVEGSYVQALEQCFSSCFERPAVVMGSGTVALTLLFDSLLGKKREVIVPALSFAATLQALVHANAVPVFCDVLPDSWLADPADVESRINSQTGAILAVHLFGVPAEIERLEELGRRHNIPVVFDACQAYGQRYAGRNIGAFGAASVFSLDASKLVTGALGGVIALDDPDLIERLRWAKTYGNDSERRTVCLGFNGKMGEISAAMALRHLEGSGRRLAASAERIGWYRSALTGLPGVVMQAEGASSAGRTYFAVFLDHPDPDAIWRVRELLRSGRIEARVYNPTRLQNLPFFNSGRRPVLPVTERLAGRLLCLPVHEGIAREHVSAIRTILLDGLR